MNDDKEDVVIKVYDSKNKKLINMNIDELIPLMVAAQIDIDFNLEVIKVQCIIARTILIRKSKTFGGKGCSLYPEADFCLDGHCGKIMGLEDLKSKWKDKFQENFEKIKRAERETKKLIITFNNKVIDPEYHSTCGGATENSENVKNHKVVYLRKVLCDRCEESPYWQNEKDITMKEIEEKLGINFNKLSAMKGPRIEGVIEEIERDEEGRICKIKIGDKIFKGTEIMENLGLNSTRFGWSPVIMRFQTIGKGHGLGLCQYGANKMAKEGKSLEEIIRYYYTGVDIKKYEKPTKDKPLNNRILVIDPGHGGEKNPGIIGAKGLMEKDVNLQIAEVLKEILQNSGAKVKVTREEDIYVPLSKRARIANENRPDFFISIHMNSFTNPSISGTEVYHYRGDKQGEILASFIIRKMTQELKTINKGVKTADFYLLKSVTTSAVHLEVAYLSNPQEEKKLTDKKYIEKIAKSIADGIKEYYAYHL